MVAFHHKLNNRIVGILVLFFLAALAAISVTLWISWRLEGGGAAINDAGSQRMRTYKIAFLLSQETDTKMEWASLQGEVIGELTAFEKVLSSLEQGDPGRPLFLPKEEPIQERVKALLGWSP